MKPLLIAVVALLALVACNNKKAGKKWAESERTNFLRVCMTNAVNQFQNDSSIAATYCNCVLEKVEAKYPSEADAHNKMTVKETNEFAEQCIP